MNFKGIGVQRDLTTAKRVISNNLLSKNDGRFLYLNYKIFKEVDKKVLVKSCIEGYGKAFT